ncbi:MAG: hypothetical protein LAT63_09770, partial [Marinobacter sp.]|nr:hypothetical protein [Marinobacter sp.]
HLRLFIVWKYLRLKAKMPRTMSEAFCGPAQKLCKSSFYTASIARLFYARWQRLAGSERVVLRICALVTKTSAASGRGANP